MVNGKYKYSDDSKGWSEVKGCFTRIKDSVSVETNDEKRSLEHNDPQSLFLALLDDQYVKRTFVSLLEGFESYTIFPNTLRQPQTG